MSLLKSVTSSRKIMPICALLYGVEGIGKSSFAANAPNPIILGAEENDELNVAHHKIKDWEEMIHWLTAVKSEDHEYKTLAIDTVDSLEALVHDYILRNSSEKNMAKALGGYGAAYKVAAQEFIRMRDKFLVPIRARGMNIILLAHADKVKFEDPIAMLTYDTYEMKLHKKARPVFTEWVSTILFANYVTHRTDDKDANKTFVVSSGDRRIFTEKRPSYNAKNRFGLPLEMPLDWKNFSSAVRSFYMGTELNKAVETTKEAFPESGPATFTPSEGTQQELPVKSEADLLKQDITELAGKIKNEQTLNAIRAAFAKAGDNVDELLRIKSKISTMI